jgi:serine/threonine-protein kinase
MDGFMNSSAIRDISASEWSLILSSFDQLVDLSHAEQATYLSKNELSAAAKKMLEKMLKARDVPHILDTTIDPLVADLLGAEVVKDQANPDDIIGRKFGAWQVTGTLASGGMGHVFLAERADGQFEKQVALKIIKSGEFSQMSQQRFVEEMRILAQFEHPNIAHLLDGGTSDDGIAYFVMEWVQGKPISEYVADKQLGLKARIGLVLQAIEAVEYAHQNLFIHGDIKPANILVNESGQVKLVDFGIARPMKNQQDLEYLPQYTPSYSSPEQAQGKPLSTASDVFGLSAVLFELCSGSAPRNKESMATQTAFTDKINTAISTAYSNYQLNRKLDQRPAMFIDSKKCSHALSKELGSIIDKGLQVKVDKRYKNTTELRSDLLLFLEGSAVPIFANNWLYRWQKSALKYKWTVGFSTLALLSIISVAMVALHQARLAQQEAEKANWSKDFVLGIFDKADPVKNMQNPISVNELTQQAADHLLLQDLEFAPEVKLNSLSLLGSIQYKLGQAESAVQIHKKHLELLLKFSPDPERIAAAHFDLALDYQQLGDFESALTEFKQTSETLPLETKVTHMGVMALQSIALSKLRMNELNSASEIINQLNAMESEILQADQAESSMSNLAFADSRLAIAQKNYPAALKAITKAKSYAQKLADDPITMAEYLSTEADIYAYLKQYDQSVKAGQQALEIFRLHYGPSHPETMIALSNHASNLGNSGQHEAAITLYREMLVIIKDIAVPDFYQPIMLQNLAHQYRKNAQHQQAIEVFEQAIPLWQSLQQPNPIGLASTYSGVARSYFALAELEFAEQYFDLALQQIAQQQGTESSTYAKYLLMKAPLMIEQSRVEELEKLFPQIHKTMSLKYGNNSTEVADVYLNWAQFQAHQGDLVAASQKAQLAHDIYHKNKPISQHRKSIAKVIKLL